VTVKPANRPPNETNAEEDPRGLQPELQATLERVGKNGYARATAAEFAPGGKFAAKKRRQRTALT
jgi:hypothetical protein